jgi:hypothetical protein
VPVTPTSSLSLPRNSGLATSVCVSSLTLCSHRPPKPQALTLLRPNRPSVHSTGSPDSRVFYESTTASNCLTFNMSSSMSEATGKQKRRSVKKLEKCQGFDFSTGLSSISRAIRDRDGPIGDLYESLKSLNSIRDISPQKLRREARELFDMLGPHLWPRDTSTAWWLLKPPYVDYPRHLYYDDREDQEQYVLGGLHTSLLSLTTTTDFGFTSRRWSRRSASIMKTT